MSWIESQSFNGNENLEIHNQGIEAVDKLQEISAFFEDNFFETTEFQNSFYSFSTEQQAFINDSFAQLNENYPDELLNVVIETDGLPYDQESFTKFQEEIIKLLKDIWLEKAIQDYSKNGSVENVESNLEIKESNLETKESNLETKELNLETKESNDRNNEMKEAEISTLSEKIRNTYSQVEIDWVLQDVQLKDPQWNLKNLDNLYQAIEWEWVEKDIKFIELYWAKLLEYIAQNGSKEQFESLYRDLENAQLQYWIVIEGFDTISTWNEKSIDTPNTIPDEENAIKHWLDTSDFHITETQGSALIYGDQKIDFSEKPPVKYITNGDFELKSGELDYKVDKQLRSDIFVLEHKIPKLENQISNLESNMSKLDSFSQNLSQMDSFNEQTLDYLYEQFLREHGNPLRNDILWTINTQGEIDMGRLKSLLLEDNENKKQELLININDKKELLQEQKTQLQLMKQKLSDMQNAFKEQVLEKDEKVRKILEFVWQIWLDLIQPQSRLDQIFRELKDNSLKISGLNLDPQKIDLANGRFGESDMEQSTDKWKINLIKFFNKMISWDTNQPHDVQQFVSVWGKTINPTEFKQTLEDAWVINDMWEAQITKIRQNLTSVWNVSTEESEKNKEK